MNNAVHIFLFAVILSCHLDLYADEKVVINHTNWDPSKFDVKILDEVRTKKIIYLHRSIGSNIVTGLMRLEKEEPERYELYISHAPMNPRFMRKPGLGHDMFLKLMANNPDKRSYYDTAAFDSTMRSQNADGKEWGHVVDIAYFNVGWSGIRRHIDVNDFFRLYVSTLEALITDYPSCKFIYFTCPIKGVVNKEWQKLDNIACHTFNEKLRDYVEQFGGYLFDIADIQSHTESGALVTFHHNAIAYPQLWFDPENSMLHGWSSDGGHLNERGERRVALAMWSLWVKVIS